MIKEKCVKSGRERKEDPDGDKLEEVRSVRNGREE